jgi:hypothetical protein
MDLNLTENKVPKTVSFALSVLLKNNDALLNN